MPAFWLTFTDNFCACVEAVDGPTAIQIGTDARANDGAMVIGVAALPYPANPRIGPKTDCPSFCWQPHRCAGNTSCPRNPCCTN